MFGFKKRNINRGNGVHGGSRRGGRGLGPGGKCVCTNPECGHEIKHTAGKPCYKEKCPKCGSPMVREK